MLITVLLRKEIMTIRRVGFRKIDGPWQGMCFSLICRMCTIIQFKEILKARHVIVYLQFPYSTIVETSRNNTRERLAKAEHKHTGESICQLPLTYPFPKH